MRCIREWVLIFVICFFQGLCAEPVKICLTLIVKDDGEEIERCLESVKEIIDCISISDIGSTDRTIPTIQKFMEKTGIPGKIYIHEWVDWGTNRTLALQAGQKTARESGFTLQNTYLLVLDPDTVLKVRADFKKENLQEDNYLFLEKNPLFSSYETRLFRASQPLEAKGIVHESIVSKVPGKTQKLETLYTEEQDVKEKKAIKCKKEIKLLTKALKHHPDSPHHQFYLAQSYHYLKDFEAAIKWYKARIESSEEREQVWYSKFMIGKCFEEMHDWEQALYWYLEAYQANPHRAETLQKIATHYRQQGENDLAYLFAKSASTIPDRKEETLFIHEPLYQYELDQELSISAYYTRFKEDGYSSSDRLLLRKNVPWFIKDQTYKNMLFYADKLKNATFVPVPVHLPAIKEGTELHYNPMNPSILKTDYGYKFICRTVNFTLMDGVYRTIDIADDTIRTKNFLIHYDKKFQILFQKEIVENLPRAKTKPHFKIEGLEDCRLIEYKKSDWFTCTTFDTNPSGPCQISLCKLEDQRGGDRVNVEKLIPLLGPDPRRYEKNWLPFLSHGELHLIYSCHPFTVYRPNIETGECETVFRYEPDYDFSSFRGSAPPIEFDDGYLMLVHEVVYFSENRRCYLHRFLYLDANFKVTKVSKPFIFQHIGVEYCCSMTLDHTERELILPIGIEDKEAYLCFVDLDTIRSLLYAL